VFDAIRVGEDGVAIFGTDPSAEQINKLRAMKKIYVTAYIKGYLSGQPQEEN
jgi:hypothetical protein